MGRKTQRPPPTEGPEADEYHLDPPVDDDEIDLDAGFEAWTRSLYKVPAADDSKGE